MYAVVAAALITSAVLLAASAESGTRRSGVLASLAPRIYVPPGRGKIILGAAGAIVATWAVGGFYQAFGPAVAEDQLGTTSAFVAALVFSSYMVLNPLGGPIASRLRPATGQRLGMVLFVATFIPAVLLLASGNTAGFLAASLACGVAQGVALTSANRAILTGITPGDRAGTLATIFLISYSGAAIPTLLAGRLSQIMPLTTVATGYAILAVAGMVLTLFLARDVSPESRSAASST